MAEMQGVVLVGESTVNFPSDCKLYPIQGGVYERYGLQSVVSVDYG